MSHESLHKKVPKHCSLLAAIIMMVLLTNISSAYESLQGPTEVLFHNKAKAYSPQTNGICERFHRTAKEEFYEITFRKNLYQKAGP